MKHIEEGSFQIHLNLSAEFPEDYQGEEDGFAWQQKFQKELRPALLKAITQVLRAEGGLEVLPSPRGLNAQDVAEYRVIFRP